ncbi:MAG: phosphoglycerate kinase [Halofilum sp. (in: g-proteobacteria)]|nr:phosphoglycerate kinase [Halofilum sp. (in: g-proteobacteria)]
MLRMTELDLAGKRVLMRLDLNSPVHNGHVTSDERIRASLPTIRAALNAGARVAIMAHLGRPDEGHVDSATTLKPIAERLELLLGRTVPLVRDWIDGLPEIEPGQLVLCENVRCQVGEKANDETLARKMAALCDVFVMDAFGVAHRAQASTHGVAQYAPVACAGPLLLRELAALKLVLEEPVRPLVAIVGGSKVSTKLGVLDALLHKVDQLIVGGGIANTFIAAQGHSVGKSMYEPDLVDNARRLIAQAEERGAAVPVPVDAVVAPELSDEAPATVKPVTEIGDDDMILDVGPQTRAKYAGLLAEAGTIMWNGPVGVFEIEAFSEGTRALALAIAASSGYSIAGGGDTLAALHRFGMTDRMSYISTGGGAFLEYVEHGHLPAVDILEQRADQH